MSKSRCNKLSKDNQTVMRGGKTSELLPFQESHRRNSEQQLTSNKLSSIISDVLILGEKD